mmetsp:Transcript_28077/g.75838  ORF Transcript_28077/g.75838 Transcript_28077/m.75838 type:complete len:330 (+) Transcript_28077:1204-2193(+)
MTRGERECFPNPPDWSKFAKTTPVTRENLRCEMQEKQRALVGKSTERLSSYTARNTSHGTPPLDRTQLFTDGRVQDHAALPGQRPSVPSSRPDAAIANQNNTLRFKRQCGYAETIPKDGGRHHTPTTLNDNWTQERFDRNYKPGWHVKELRLNKLWDTEHTASYTMHSHPSYAERLAKSNIVAPQPEEEPEETGFPKKQATPAVAADHTGYSVGYARYGFGESPFQDHTSAFKRGAEHVGTAPVNFHESIAHTTYGKGQPLEWQLNRGKFTNTVPKMDDCTLRAHQDLIASQHHTAAWKSTNHADFTDHKHLARRQIEAQLPPHLRAIA